MESLTHHPLLHNWQRKLIAIIGAIAIWLFVNQSITTTRTISNVPVRLINLPPDRTVEGLLANGILSRRLTLTLTGTKDAVETLEPSDLEVVVDASTLPDESVFQVSKKNLISLEPDFDPMREITSVDNSEFVIKLSKLVTEKIPIIIGPPLGEPPENYQFLDIWPQQLYHTVTGPEEQVKRLEEKGLELTLDLNKITKAELDAIEGSAEAFRNDEVAFSVPESWKKVVIPFIGDQEETINDPVAKELYISFLREQLIPLNTDIPVRVFYPIDHSNTLNPRTHPLAKANWIGERNGITLTPLHLLANGVSQWFVDVIRNSVEITIVAVSTTEREQLQWGIEFVNLHELEDTFVAFLMADHASAPRTAMTDPKKKESRLRRRFRDYVQKMRLYKGPNEPLQLDCRLGDHSIIARDISAPD